MLHMLHLVLLHCAPGVTTIFYTRYHWAKSMHAWPHAVSDCLNLDPFCVVHMNSAFDYIENLI